MGWVYWLGFSCTNRNFIVNIVEGDNVKDKSSRVTETETGAKIGWLLYGK